MSKTKPIPLPRSLSVTQIAERQGLKAVPREAVRERMKQMVADSLHVPNPPAGTTGMSMFIDTDASTIDLPVMEIEFYDRNPRHAPNAEFETIKESIRAKGLENPLIVTRRPNSLRYMLAKGGNTRLRALQELWQETQEARFGTVMCIFRTWKSESDVLASHLIENEVRGEMSFWDKASGILALKASLEAEDGKALSLRELEDRLKQIGLPASKSNLAQFSFAVRCLPRLGPALTGLDVRQIQPVYGRLKRLATRFGKTEEAFVTSIFVPAQDEVALSIADEGSTVDLTAFQADAERRLAAWLGLDHALASKMLRLLEQLPDMPLGELQAQAHAASVAPFPKAVPHGTQSLPASFDPLMPGEHAIDPAIDSTDAQLVGEEVSPESAAAQPPSVGIASVARSPVTSEQIRAKALAAFLVKVTDLVRDVGIGNVFHVVPEAPVGFFVDLPPEDFPIATGEDPANRALVWQILASMSGQRDAEIAALMQPALRWRTTPVDELDATIRREIGVAIDQLDPALLADPGNRFCLPLLAVLRSFHDYCALVGGTPSGDPR